MGKLLHLTYLLKKLSTLLLQKLSWDIKIKEFIHKNIWTSWKFIMALNGFVKPFWQLLFLLPNHSQTFRVHIKRFRNRFNWLTITNKCRNRLTSAITNDRVTIKIDRITIWTISWDWLISCFFLILTWL